NSDGNQMFTFLIIMSEQTFHIQQKPKWYDILQITLLKNNSSCDTITQF
ncbi:10812_t:CDS:1, partial [Funneliformis geosporum]